EQVGGGGGHRVGQHDLARELRVQQVVPGGGQGGGGEALLEALEVHADAQRGDVEARPEALVALGVRGERGGGGRHVRRQRTGLGDGDVLRARPPKQHVGLR